MCLLGFGLGGCATSLPEPKHDRYAFPDKVFIEEPTGRLQGVPYKPLGWVKAKATWPTMEHESNNQSLCRNYYNRAARNLAREAEKAGADAVIRVRSIVILLDGKTEEHPTPECSDDGAEGEILLRGVAIKFTPPPKAKR